MTEIPQGEEARIKAALRRPLYGPSSGPGELGFKLSEANVGLATERVLDALRPAPDDPSEERGEEALRAIVAEAERIYEEAGWFCNKCGFHGKVDEAGPAGDHPNCPYLAAKSNVGWELHNFVLARATGKGDNRR